LRIGWIVSSVAQYCFWDHCLYVMELLHEYLKGRKWKQRMHSKTLQCHRMDTSEGEKKRNTKKWKHTFKSTKTIRCWERYSRHGEPPGTHFKIWLLIEIFALLILTAYKQICFKAQQDTSFTCIWKHFKQRPIHSCYKSHACHLYICIHRWSWWRQQNPIEKFHYLCEVSPRNWLRWWLLFKWIH